MKHTLKDFEANATPEDYATIGKIFDEKIHWIDRARFIYKLQFDNDYSERQLSDILGISKSEIHRMLEVGRLPDDQLILLMALDIDKWAIITFLDFRKKAKQETVKEIAAKMYNGEIRTRSELKEFICTHGK